MLLNIFFSLLFHLFIIFWQVVEIDRKYHRLFLFSFLRISLLSLLLWYWNSFDPQFFQFSLSFGWCLTRLVAPVTPIIWTHFPPMLRLIHFCNALLSLKFIRHVIFTATVRWIVSFLIELLADLLVPIPRHGNSMAILSLLFSSALLVWACANRAVEFLGGNLICYGQIEMLRITLINLHFASLPVVHCEDHTDAANLWNLHRFFHEAGFAFAFDVVALHGVLNVWILLNNSSGQVFLWHGGCSSK